MLQSAPKWWEIIIIIYEYLAHKCFTAIFNEYWHWQLRNVPAGNVHSGHRSWTKTFCIHITYSQFHFAARYAMSYGWWMTNANEQRCNVYWRICIFILCTLLVVGAATGELFCLFIHIFYIFSLCSLLAKRKCKSITPFHFCFAFYHRVPVYYFSYFLYIFFLYNQMTNNYAAPTPTSYTQRTLTTMHFSILTCLMAASASKK